MSLRSANIIRSGHRDLATKSLLAILCLVLGATLRAQTVTIQLLDGHTGHPIAATCVFTRIENDPRNTVPLLTDKDGIALLHLTGKNPNHGNECGLPGSINTALKQGESLWVGIDHYVICQAHTSEFLWGTIPSISTSQLLSEGFAAPNTCGKPTASAKPGQLIIFIRPMTRWEKLRGNIWE